MTYRTLTKLADISLNNGTKLVTVHSPEGLDHILQGDVLLATGWAAQIDSVNTVARTITLMENWDETTITNGKAQVLPTSADFREARARMNDLVLLGTQSISQIDTLANTIGTVTITLPDESTVDIPSVPKLILDASQAGTDLYAAAEQAIILMGDAPALAEQVADNVADFNPKYAEWAANSPYFLANYSTVNAAIADYIAVQRPAAEAAAALTVAYATTAEDVLVPGTSDYSLVHWAAKAEYFAGQAEQIAGGTAPNSLKLGDETAAQWQAKIDAKVPQARTVAGKALTGDITLNPADITNLQSTLTTLELYALYGATR